MPKKFASLGEFADYLLRLKAVDEKRKIEALEAIGKYVKEKAQSKFGTYQDAAGKFPAWAPLEDATQTQRASLGYEPNNPLYRTGGLMDSIDYKVEPNKVTIGSADPIMEWQEFGTATIPPRPVLGPAMLESVPEIKKILQLMMINWLTGKKP